MGQRRGAGVASVCRVNGEIRAEPTALVRLAEETLLAADRLADALARTQTAGSPPASAYGDTATAGQLQSTVDAVLAEAGTAATRLTGVYEADVDRLLQVAFAYRRADVAAAIRQPRPYGAPVPS